MLRRILAVALLGILAAVPAGAQFAPVWSQGPSIPMYSIRWDESGQAASSFLSEGAGYSFNCNMLPSADGRWRYLTVGLPFFMQVPQQEGMGFSTGLMVGTLNNLFAVGCALDMAKFGDVDTGLLVGNFSKQNVAILVSMNFNFGGGSKEAPAQAVKSRSAPVGPPPNYITW